MLARRLRRRDGAYPRSAGGPDQQRTARSRARRGTRRQARPRSATAPGSRRQPAASASRQPRQRVAAAQAQAAVASDTASTWRPEAAACSQEAGRPDLRCGDSSTRVGASQQQSATARTLPSGHTSIYRLAARATRRGESGHRRLVVAVSDVGERRGVTDSARWSVGSRRGRGGRRLGCRYRPVRGSAGSPR